MATPRRDTDGRHDHLWSRRQLSIAVWFLVGCLGTRPPTGADGPTPTATTTGTPPSGPTSAAGATKRSTLDSALVAVARASDPEAAAEARGLRTRDGRVLVVVVLKPGRDLPAAPAVVVTSRTDQSVVGYVAYADLDAIAASENVSMVRPPNTVY